MKIVTPKFYKDFKCIGSACRHNCCIGWEIDIDPDTMEKYKRVGGALGKRLDVSIGNEGGCHHFILGENERCPFLNKSNLCDIISALGEGYLCEICNAHPRFKNYFSDRVEIGLGLCCEEACRITLENKEPFSLVAEENAEPCGDISQYETELISYRDSVISVITDRSRTVEDRINNVGILSIPSLGLNEWAKYLLSLEIMSEEWRELLEKAEEKSVPLTHYGYEGELESLMAYFIYRYMTNEKYDGKNGTVIAFSVLCSRIITTLWSHFAQNSEEMIGICRLFSQEIEYSEENVEAIFDMIEEYNEIQKCGKG
ncbi:MAG: flagellin lysine-N-methylase [Clostridia bacterium]|nr:flagellin lysine-N-methylase [Clostridia bacterium]